MIWLIKYKQCYCFRFGLYDFYIYGVCICFFFIIQELKYLLVVYFYQSQDDQILCLVLIQKVQVFGGYSFVLMVR